MSGTISIEFAILLGINIDSSAGDNEMQTMGVTESRRKFGDLMRHFKAGGEPIRVTNRQGASAVLISFSEYQEIMESRLTSMQQPAEPSESTSEGTTQ
jgi:prevent-host-death family protein